MKGTLTKFKAAGSKETSYHKGSDDAVVTSKVAECEWKSDASQEEFYHRSLAVGNMWDSLPKLLENIKLRELKADDAKGVRKILHHLCTNMFKPARNKLDSQHATTRNLLLQLVGKVQLVCDASLFLD